MLTNPSLLNIYSSSISILGKHCWDWKERGNLTMWFWLNGQIKLNKESWSIFYYNYRSQDTWEPLSRILSVPDYQKFHILILPVKTIIGSTPQVWIIQNLPFYLKHYSQTYFYKRRLLFKCFGGQLTNNR